jgi:hypothetical protein
MRHRCRYIETVIAFRYGAGPEIGTPTQLARRREMSRALLSTDRMFCPLLERAAA